MEEGSFKSTPSNDKKHSHPVPAPKNFIVQSINAFFLHLGLKIKERKEKCCFKKFHLHPQTSPELDYVISVGIRHWMTNIIWGRNCYKSPYNKTSISKLLTENVLSGNLKIFTFSSSIPFITTTKSTDTHIFVIKIGITVFTVLVMIKETNPISHVLERKG